MHARSSMLVLIVSLSGCSMEPSDELGRCGPGGEPMMELGQGGAAYQPVENGEMALERGPQGGYHLVLAVQAENLDASEPVELVLKGYRGEDQLAQLVAPTLLLCDSESSALQAWGLLLIWNTELDELLDKMVTIEATITDAASSTTTTSAQVLLTYP